MSTDFNPPGGGGFNPPDDGPPESEQAPQFQPVTPGKGAGMSGILIGVGIAVVGGIFVCGILAAIAIPNFVQMQYRAKRAEMPANVDGIKTAQIAYDAAFDTYVEVRDFQPDARPGKAQRSWNSGSSFDTLGWGPDGKVRGSYRVVRKGPFDFVVQGIGDVDGDGQQSRFTATKSINTTMNTGASAY